MRCLYPWTQLYIEGTGVVKPCCSRIELGNLRHAGIVDILASADAESLRGAHVREVTDDLPVDCRGCYALARQADLHSFNGLYDVGAEPEQGLRELAELGNQAFVDNYRVVRDCYLRGEQLPAGAKPLGLWCQLGEHCNIRCIMCWQDHDKPVRLSPAQIDQVRALIPTLHTLQFTGGEPTLYKEFWELIDHFRVHATPRSKVMVLTNGLLLKGKLQRFDGIGRVVLAVNIDGPTRASYEKIRYGGEWDTLLANLDAIRDYRVRAENAGRVSVTLAFTLMKSNIDFIPEGIALAEAYGASWTCGIVTGEFEPVPQCRTYFEENIFRFAHLGRSKEAIIARLQEGVELCRASTYSSAVGVSCLEATIALVRQTEQIDIAPEKVARMRAIEDDHRLSRAIQEIVLARANVGQKSIGELIQIVGLRRKQAGPSSVETAAAGLELGRGHLAQGDCAAALPHLEHALEILQKAHGASHPDTADAALELSRCLGGLDRWAEAEPFARRACTFHARADGKPRAATAAATFALGRCLRARHRAAEAEPLLRQALADYKKLYGAENSYCGTTAFELALALMARRQHAEAATLLCEVLSLYERILGLEHCMTAETVFTLARCYRALGQKTHAQAVLMRLMSHCAATLGPAHQITRRASLELNAWKRALTRVWRMTKRALKKAVRGSRPGVVKR